MQQGLIKYFGQSFLGFWLLLLAMTFTWAGSVQANIFDRFSVQQELLPDEEAFQVVSSDIKGDQLVVVWQSQPDYYLYRKNFKLESTSPEVVVGELILPTGETEDDPLFGKVEVYFNEVTISAPLSLAENHPGELEFILHGQGCNKPVGICYPPQKRKVLVDLSAFSPLGTAVAAEAQGSTDNGAIESAANLGASGATASFWYYIATAFGAGLLLVFTPCVLPVLPILSSLIVGQGDTVVSRWRGGIMSVAYVLGTSVTYTLMGVLAGAAGLQLQAFFQHPAAIIVMTVILVVLSLSMFGLFNMQLPHSMQEKINDTGRKIKPHSLGLAFVLGLLSALVVSACVSPLLILALGVAVQQGDPWLGGAMMFSMAMGMGVLLIAFGFGASWLLPKAGVWMNRIKELFGFLVLGVAIIVLSSIKVVPVLLLWALLLLVAGFWLWSIARQLNPDSVLQATFRALAVAGLLWGGLALIGGLSGGTELQRPLATLALNSGGSVVVNDLPFQKVDNAQDLEALLIKAREQQQPVLVDYYADWCTDCVRMERTTFREAEVHAAVNGWLLVKADVTKVNATTQALKDRFKVFGPPATLFISASGQERGDLHRYGYIRKDDFLQLAQANAGG